MLTFFWPKSLFKGVFWYCENAKVQRAQGKPLKMSDLLAAADLGPNFGPSELGPKKVELYQISLAPSILH